MDTLQKTLGYTFKDPGLLRLALTHPSVTHETGSRLESNQRLEFLGDAVLQLALTRELYEKFPQLEEGQLTQARAQMVNTRSLAAQARNLGLGQFLILSRGEESSGGRGRDSALADAFEALFGAIYLDSDFETARAIILRLFHDAYGPLDELPSLTNPKGELQELIHCQSADATILYRVESISGPDHGREYEVSVSHGGVELGRGRGSSKKEAEGRAAEAALAGLRKQAAGGPSPG